MSRDDRIDEPPVFLGRRRARARDLEALAQTRQRRAQIMGNVVGDLAQALHEGVNPIQHLVQARRQQVEIVARAAGGNALRQIPGHDRLGRDADGFDAAEHARAHKDAADQPEEHGEQDSPAEGADDHLAGLAKLIGALTDQEEMPIGQHQALGPHQIAFLCAFAFLRHRQILPADMRRARRQIARQLGPGRIEQQGIGRAAHRRAGLMGDGVDERRGPAAPLYIRQRGELRLHGKIEGLGHEIGRGPVDNGEDHQDGGGEQPQIEQCQAEAVAAQGAHSPRL